MYMKRLLLALLFMLTLTVTPVYSGDAEDLGDGMKAFIEGDHKEAFSKWEPIAMKENAIGQYYLGALYDNAGDFIKAFKWYTLSSEQGNAEAQFNLGQLYFLGNGVPQNFKNAVKWFTLSAEQNDSDAQGALGLIYYYGRKGVPKDHARGIQFWKLSAKQDNAYAQYNLGNYSLKLGQKYYKGALMLFRLAAEQGLAPAQSNLGAMYSNGVGVPVDIVQAYMWFTLAGNSGVDIAIENKKALEKIMEPEQTAKGQQLAKGWMKRNSKKLKSFPTPIMLYEK
jgi:uncharacterized protein